MAGRCGSTHTRAVRMVHGRAVSGLVSVTWILGSMTAACTATPAPQAPTPQPHAPQSPTQQESPQPPVQPSPRPPDPSTGGHIAFVSDREGVDSLYLMRGDGSGVRRLTSELPPVSHPAWSPTGSGSRSTPARRARATSTSCPRTGPASRGSPARRGRTSTRWSPDGRRLAFSSNRDGDWDIYVMDVDGRNVRQLVDSPGSTTSRSGRRTAPGSASRPPAAARPAARRRPGHGRGGDTAPATRPRHQPGLDPRRVDAGVQRRDVCRLRHRGAWQPTASACAPSSPSRPRRSGHDGHPTAGRSPTTRTRAGHGRSTSSMWRRGASRPLTQEPGFDGQPAWQPAAPAGTTDAP